MYRFTDLKVFGRLALVTRVNDEKSHRRKTGAEGNLIYISIWRTLTFSDMFYFGGDISYLHPSYTESARG